MALGDDVQASDLNVLTEALNEERALLLECDRAILGVSLLHERIEFCFARFCRLLSDVAQEMLELLILRDKVRLGVDFDECNGCAAFAGADKTFVGLSALFFDCRGNACLAEPLNGFIDIAFRLIEGFFALAHADA